MAKFAAGALEPRIGVGERLQHERDEFGHVLLGAVGAAVDLGIVGERRFECYSACVFGADRRANPLTSLESEGSKFDAD